MSDTVKVYVALLDEGVDVWRPVEAKHLRGSTYQLVEQAYDRELEVWQFEPGDTVECETTESAEGSILAAVAKA